MTSTQFLIPHMIEKKRDGQEFTCDEIEYLIQAITRGEAQGTQLGAWLMAVYLNSMSLNETIWLTAAMVRSGEQLVWPEEWKDIMVDKHSTGGVGDKVSLPLAPALAACGLKVPMISGRGLGHTGGTLDKLESIPGFEVSQSHDRVLEIMADVGCCIVGQTENIVPADRILYATRDITATVGSLPLISASIISKKAAENLSSLVLDVKVGKGAVFSNENEARKLAKTMVGISNGLGTKTVAVLTEMTNPIGYMVGNSLEVKEAVDCLNGGGPEDLRELVTYLGGQILYLQDKAKSVEEGATVISEKLDDGSALEKFRQMIMAQGVNEEDANNLCAETIMDKDLLPQAEHIMPIYSQTTGYVSEIESLSCARVCCALGAGRAKWGDEIQYGVGLQFLVSAGSYIEKGEPWMLVHHNETLHPGQVTQLSSAIEISNECTLNATRSRIRDIIS